nr:UDP-N-acetylglucosamine 2-epimerase [Candidatus Brachybacter algidus]
MKRRFCLKGPDLVLVVGDVTSTMACSVTAKKMKNITVAHVEGGIRSGDLTMPEEINRLVTDAISDLFFTTSESANQNFKKEGVSDEKIHFCRKYHDRYSVKTDAVFQKTLTTLINWI